MALCEAEDGKLFWTRQRARVAMTACASCGKPLCHEHARRRAPDDSVCPGCQCGGQWFGSGDIGGDFSAARADGDGRG